MTSLTESVIVSPTFPLEWRDVEDFLGEFGPFNGRYVPRYPNDWSKILLAHLKEISDIPPVQRARLLERISHELWLCTTPVSWPWNAEKNWAFNLAQHIKNSQSKIIVGDALDPTPHKNWSEQSGNIKESRIRTLIFPGSISGYLKICTPLLVNSPSAYFIDKYINPFSNEIENFLISILNIINGSRCYTIDIITSKQVFQSKVNTMVFSETKTIENKFREIFQPRLPKSRAIRLHLVEESKNDNSLWMHDRFFLTQHGGIGFGQGFFISKDRQNAYAVEKRHLTELKEIYIDGVARHKENIPKKSGIQYPKKVETIEIAG